MDLSLRRVSRGIGIAYLCVGPCKPVHVLSPGAMRLKTPVGRLFCSHVVGWSVTSLRLRCWNLSIDFALTLNVF
eukprot:scaffold46740_cov402-Skeletonema_marinoi.AAC.1